MRKLTCALMCVTAAASFLLARPSAAADDSEVLDYLIAGVKDSRSQLKSGIFDAHGSLKFSDQQLGLLDGPVEIHCAFDFASGLIRFDRTQPSQMIGIPPGRSEKTWMRSIRDTKLARSPGKLLIYDANARKLNTFPADAELPSDFGPFDVRAAGLLNLMEFNDASYTFEQSLAPLLQARPQSITKESKGVYHLVWQLDQARRDLWLDESSGFSPIRLDYTLVPDVAKSQPATNQPRLLASTEVAWAKVQRV